MILLGMHVKIGVDNLFFQCVLLCVFKNILCVRFTS